MEFAMLGLLFSLLLLYIWRIGINKGIEIYDILIITNILYFLFSGVYHHIYFEGQNIYSDEIIFTGYMGIILYIIGIFIGASYFRQNYFYFNIQESRSSAFHSFKNYYGAIRFETITALYIISLVLKYLYYIKGERIVYGANFEESDSPISYPITALLLFWDLINKGIFVYALINIIFKKHGHKILCISIITTELSFSIISRRDFAFNIIILLIIYLTSIKKINIRALIISATLSLVTIELILPFIFEFRKEFARQYSNTGEITTSLELLFEEHTIQEDASEYTRNIATRGYIISSNFELIEAKLKSSISPLNGTVALNSLIFITPYYLFPGKRDYAPPDQLMLEHFELPQYDHSENIPYAAYADLGFYGPFIYGLIIGLTVVIIQRYCISNLNKYPLASISSLTYLLVHCLNFEGLPIIHFILIRDIAIIYISSRLISNLITKVKYANTKDIRSIIPY